MMPLRLLHMLTACNGRKEGYHVPVFQKVIRLTVFAVDDLKQGHFTGKFQPFNNISDSGIVRQLHFLLFRTVVPQGRKEFHHDSHSHHYIITKAGTVPECGGFLPGTPDKMPELLTLNYAILSTRWTMCPDLFLHFCIPDTKLFDNENP